MYAAVRREILVLRGSQKLPVSSQRNKLIVFFSPQHAQSNIEDAFQECESEPGAAEHLSAVGASLTSPLQHLFLAQPEKQRSLRRPWPALYQVFFLSWLNIFFSVFLLPKSASS